MREQLLPFLGRRIKCSGTVDLINFQTSAALAGMLDVRLPDGNVLPHVWLRLKITQADKLLQGDRITFTAKVYQYKRIEDQADELGLSLPEQITIVDKNNLVGDKTS